MASIAISSQTSRSAATGPTRESNRVRLADYKSPRQPRGSRACPGTVQRGPLGLHTDHREWIALQFVRSSLPLVSGILRRFRRKWGATRPASKNGQDVAERVGRERMQLSEEARPYEASPQRAEARAGRRPRPSSANPSGIVSRGFSLGGRAAPHGPATSGLSAIRAEGIFGGYARQHPSSSAKGEALEGLERRDIFRSRCALFGRA